jgi:hypothetical protein
MAVFAGNGQGGAVGIAGNCFLRNTLRPLSMSLERTQKHSDLEKSFSEHGTTYLGALVVFRLVVVHERHNCTGVQFRDVFTCHEHSSIQTSSVRGTLCTRAA